MSRVLARSLGAVCFVAVLAPLVGALGFWVVLVITSKDFVVLRAEEVLGLYQETALPTLAAAVVFVALTVACLRLWPGRLSRLALCGIGAAVFLAVFGYPLWERIVLGSHSSSASSLIACLGAVAGAACGALLPRQLLPAQGKTSNAA